MNLLRMFHTDSEKGKTGYLNSQKKYEILRTCLYFGISLSLFAAGWISTGNKMNLLTIVAVLGCLPASKSAVQMIMFLRYKSLSKDLTRQVSAFDESLTTLYDLVFTSYDKNYAVGHMAVCGLTLVGFSEQKQFSEKEFQAHLTQLLKNERISGVTIKIFTEEKKYLDRLHQLTALEDNPTLNSQIVSVIKSVSL